MHSITGVEDHFGFGYLLASRAFRSVGIIYMTLATPLLLLALGVHVVYIGLVLFGTIAFGAAQTVLLGMLGERTSYRLALVIGDLIPCTAALVIGLGAGMTLMIAALIVGGLGGTAGAMRGAFSPATTALVAHNWGDERERARRLGYLVTVAAVFSIGGSLLLASHAYAAIVYGSVGAFRLLFLVAAGALLASAASVAFVRESEHEEKTTQFMKPVSRDYTLRVVASNALSGLGMGVAIPILPLWFGLAFHASTGMIGAVFAASYFATAAGSFAASRLSHRLDILLTASATRSLGGLLLVAMAFSGWLPMAAALYAARMFVSGFGSPTRSTANMRGISREDYGTATSIQGLSTRLSQTSSGISGYLLEYALEAPLLVGGALQVVGGVAYFVMLRHKNAAG